MYVYDHLSYTKMCEWFRGPLEIFIRIKNIITGEFLHAEHQRAIRNAYQVVLLGPLIPSVLLYLPLWVSVDKHKSQVNVPSGFYDKNRSISRP